MALTVLGNAALGLLEFTLVGIAPFFLGIHYQKKKQQRA
jgi:hypothetical protein